MYDRLKLATQTQFPQSIDPRAYVLFIGSKNTISKLYSHDATFLSQLYGKKVARLIHPRNIMDCSCTQDRTAVDLKCDFDVTAPNLKKNPEFGYIVVHETILEPGDVLYIPKDWLHDIRALSTSISVSSGF